MATITKDTYDMVPDDPDDFHTLDASGPTSAVTSNGIGIDFSDKEKIIHIYTTGAITIDLEHNPIPSKSFWNNILEQSLSISAYREYRVSGKVPGDIRSTITNASGQQLKVKMQFDVYTITGAYINIADFRNLSGASNADVGDDILVRYIDIAHQDVIRHVGSDKTSSDTWWRTIQEAEVMLTMHYGAIRGWDPVPLERTEVKEISSQWKEQYRELILGLTGRDPFPDVDLNETPGDVYNASLSTITPDEGSYTQSTTR